ncbi:MAG TPA: hypothetical protein PLD84_07385 [Chitinophagales bacterium]|nr:hypothetical protein [Chitinophagales bacterium]
MTPEQIAEIANISLALSLIVALVFGIAQVRVAARDRRERLTLEALRNFQSREFAELIYYIANRDMPSTREGLLQLPVNEQVMLIQFGQEMESLGMLVSEKIIDIDLVDKTLGSFVATSWQKYKLMFEDMRVKTDDPFLGEYFQWLGEEIDERMKNNPREPFFHTKRP